MRLRTITRLLAKQSRQGHLTRARGCLSSGHAHRSEQDLMKSSVKHIELLDYIRGIAIISVLLLHSLGNAYGCDMLPWGDWLRQSSVPDSFFWFLPISVLSAGVPIFFVVSGFCIHLSFQQQGQKWGSFFTRRFFRIYPAYLAALIFATVLLMAFHRDAGNKFGQADDWKQLITHLFLVHNFDPIMLTGINGAFWSLAIEAQLYLLYPALLALIAKFGWRPTMAILVACELLIRGTDGLMQTMGSTTTVAGHISWLFAYSPLGFWFSWAIGAFIADSLLKKQPLPFANSSPIWWLTFAIICYFLKPLFPFRFLLFAMLTAAVLSRHLSGVSSEIKIPSFLLTVLRKIGVWSYSIYLLHLPLLIVYTHTFDWDVAAKYRTNPIAFFYYVFLWLAVIPFGFLWYKAFELPGIALGKKIINRMKHGYGEKAFEPAKPAELQFHSAPGGQTRGATRFRYFLIVCSLIVFVVGNIFISVKLGDFYIVSKLAARDPLENNNAAWALATNPEATKRNGAHAVMFAEAACQRTEYKVTYMVGTLAAAYAEAGRYAEAVSTAKRAAAMAENNGETNLLQRNQELLRLYLNQQPYHEHNGGVPP